MIETIIEVYAYIIIAGLILEFLHSTFS